jgi:predicted transcriptional regulator
MTTSLHATLTRRERQIMDILYQRGHATAGEVMSDLSGSPTYSTVRTQLRVLEQKGHVQHEERGLRYVHTPVIPRSSARRLAVRHLVQTFFGGSTGRAVAAILGSDGPRLAEDELQRIAVLVDKSRSGKTGKKGQR